MNALKKIAAWTWKALGEDTFRAVACAVGGAVIAGFAALRDQLKGVRPLGFIAVLLTGGLLTYALQLLVRRVRRPVLVRFMWREHELDVPVTIERHDGTVKVFVSPPVCVRCGGGTKYEPRVDGSAFEVRTVGMFHPSRYLCVSCGGVLNLGRGRVETSLVEMAVEGHLHSGKRPREITELAVTRAASPPPIPPRDACTQT